MRYGGDNPMAEKLHQFGATAELLGMTDAQLRWLQHTGRAPESVLIGKRRMFRESDIEAWIAKTFAGTDAA